MAFPTWGWFLVLFLTNTISWLGWGIISALIWARATGRWGGGMKVVDFRPWPHGKINEFRISQHGSHFAQHAGGDEAIISRVTGLFGGTIDERIKVGDYVQVADIVFLGRAQIEKAFDKHLEDKDRHIVTLRNQLSWTNAELDKKTHNIDEIIEKNTKALHETAKAFMPSRPHGGSKK